MIERIPSAPPRIAPLPKNETRPLWSVMIPAYNCSKYLEQTILSVLQQDRGTDKMQIEVVDDHSTDGDIEELVQRVGKGRVGYYRKAVNMGSLRNFETCINRAKGELVHILHGDDYAMDGFYEEIESLFDRFGHIGAAFTDFFHVDTEGAVLYTDPKLLNEPAVLQDWLMHIARVQRIQPPAMVVKRSVYEKLGSFYAVKYGEDWEMWTRIAANFAVAHSPKYLACYRVHNDNISGNSLASGQNIKDVNRVIDIIQTYLPADKRKEVKNNAKRNFSIYYASVSHKLYHDYNNRKAARAQANGALMMDVNKTTVKSALKLYAKLLIRYKYKNQASTVES